MLPFFYIPYLYKGIYVLKLLIPNVCKFNVFTYKLKKLEVAAKRLKNIKLLQTNDQFIYYTKNKSQISTEFSSSIVVYIFFMHTQCCLF